MTTSSVGTSVLLTWAAPLSGGAPSAYLIEAGSAPGLSDLAKLSTPSSNTTFTADGIAAGTYYVRVRAAGPAGTSAASNEAVLLVGAARCTQAPGPAIALNVAVTGGRGVVLSWGAAYNATTHLVEAGTGPGLANVLTKNLQGSATSLTVTDVVPGTYYVRVRGGNACGTGPASNEIFLTIR